MVKNFKFQISNFKLGFSLIELLVVIGIMGTLITILLPNFIGARQRGQDARRKLDLEQIRSALEQYRSVNGSYPRFLSTLTSGTIYISTLPTDPVAASGYTYQYTSLPAGCTTAGPTFCTDYTIGATLTTGSGCTTTPTGTCGPSAAACNYCLGPFGVKWL